MNPFVWLALAVVLAVAVAFTRRGPKGANPVGRTRLMGAARMILFVGIVVCGALGISTFAQH